MLGTNDLLGFKHAHQFIVPKFLEDEVSKPLLSGITYSGWMLFDASKEGLTDALRFCAHTSTGSSSIQPIQFDLEDRKSDVLIGNQWM